MLEDEQYLTFEVFAANPENAKREHDEDEHRFRSKFERDRDRILYSKEFRRLCGKTQVFSSGYDDHIRTRLTHTLEVAQITRTICRVLKLDEILGEAIAIGHDIGHTPFGHIGERTLNYIMNGCDKIKYINNSLSNEDKGFKHNWQGIRVVMDLEDITTKYKGLNLTDYTLWGILNHSKLDYKSCDKKLEENKCSLGQSYIDCDESIDKFSLGFFEKYKNRINNDAWTIEALIVRQADEIAQRHHDIEDALEANIIDKEYLVQKIKECFGHWFDKEENNMWKISLENIQNESEKSHYLPMFSRLIVDFLTTQLVENISKVLIDIQKKYSITNSYEFYKNKDLIRSDIESNNKTLFEIFSFEETLQTADKSFQEFIGNIILNSFIAQSMDGKSNFIIRQLIKAYATNPQQLPDKTIVTLYKNYLTSADWNKYAGKSPKVIVGDLRNELKIDHFNKLDEKYKIELLRTICDYIAGMTDNYAKEQFNLLYGANHL